MPAVPVGSSSRRPPLKELNVLAAPEAPAKKSYSFFCNTDLRTTKYHVISEATL